MHRIDTPTAQKDKWGAGKNGYTDGDPTTGVKATALNAAIFDSLQEEICNAIEKSGMVLDPNDNTQLYKVLSAISTAIGDYLAIDKNLSEIKDNGSAAQSSTRSNIGCGTAATHDVTTSTSDTTPGRVLKVRDFGQGSTDGNDLLDSIFDITCERTYAALGIGSETPTEGMPDNSGNTRFTACALNVYKNVYWVFLISSKQSYSGMLDTSGKTISWNQFYNTDFKPTAADTNAIYQSSAPLTVDLNTLDGTKSGRYYQSVNANATTAFHYPVANAGTLDVYKNGAVEARGCVQEYRTYSTNKLFRRWYNLQPNSSWGWSDWIEEYNTGNMDIADYLLISSANSTYQKINTASRTANGWKKDTNTGIIEQWGSTTGTPTSSAIPFPIAYPSACYTVVGNDRGQNHISISLDNQSLTQTYLNAASATVSLSWESTGAGAPGIMLRDVVSALDVSEFEYYYSAENNAFYPSELHADYLYFGTWPDDAIGVIDSVVDEFMLLEPPEGKTRVAGGDGLPAWGDIPPPTPEQVLATNTMKFKSLLRSATDAAFPLQSALALGVITPEQQSMLTALQQFSVQLADTDLTQSPVTWPAQPAGV